MIEMTRTIDQADSYGCTALMYAIQYYTTNKRFDPSILYQLLELKCGVEQADIFGRTTLNYFRHCSISSKCDKSVLDKITELLHQSE
jgi:hypothetical protein